MIKLDILEQTGKGVDIKSTNATIEGRNPETVADAPRQLRGHRGPAYIAGTNKEAVKKAMETTKGTRLALWIARETS